jgi:hypothetical protein
MAIWAVAGSRRAYWVSTSLWSAIDTPKSPDSTAPSHLKNWTNTGWSRPNRVAISVLVAGSAKGPSTRSAKPPGKSRRQKNTSSETPNIVSSATAILGTRK